jgi:histidine ammonia-lyase
VSQHVEIGSSRLLPGDVARIARSKTTVGLAAAAWDRIAASHTMLERLAGRGEAIYGVSTGLGAAVDTRIAPDAAAQQRVPLARAVGVGPRAREDEVRAMMVARIARFATGRSAVSRQTVEALIALLNKGVHPVVPMIGSIGEADLAPLAHIASVLMGSGDAEVAGAIVTGAEALKRAGLTPPAFGPKDGIALVSSNAASVGLAALVVVDLRRTLSGLVAAAALSFEGYRASVAPLLPDAIGLRPVAGQAAIAEALMRTFNGGDLTQPKAARRLQDPLSFRCVAPVYGACLGALSAASDLVELELNSSDDNPAILSESGISRPNANFDATHLALAFETLGLALTRVAAMSGQRIMRLMSPVSSELPRFLSPIQEGRNGFATVQKTVSALVADIQHRATPMPAFIMPVADGVEDYGTMALPIVQKTGEIAARVQLLSAIELMAAAQACDLRGGIVLGREARAIHAAVRSVVATLHEDRPASPDIEAIGALIAQGIFDRALP